MERPNGQRCVDFRCPRHVGALQLVLGNVMWMGLELAQAELLARPSRPAVRHQVTPFCPPSFLVISSPCRRGLADHLLLASYLRRPPSQTPTFSSL